MLLERLNIEDEEFKTAIAEQDARQDNAVNRSFKKKLDNDHMPTSTYKGAQNHKE